MNKIQENLLYYIWMTKQFDHSNLLTLDGQPVEIKEYGFRNSASGPDFGDAKIKIGDTLWAGNVEMHIFSSDWEAHHHQHDDAYSNVILHVVYEHDRNIVFNQTNPEHQIPTIELKSKIFPKVIEVYSSLLESKSWIPCEKTIKAKHLQVFDLWKYNLGVERMWYKTNHLDELLNIKKYDWEEVLYIMICKYFGGTVNKIPFEQLAISCPIKLLYKNINNRLSIEALLFGQAGFLEANFEEPYFKKLKEVYYFLSKKYQLSPLNMSSWKFGGIRPSGFPTFRIAQLAGLIESSQNLFSKILDSKSIEDVINLFQSKASQYWENHYTFKNPSKPHTSKLTIPFIERLIINSVIPSIYLYGKYMGDESKVDYCITLLESMNAESNKVINHWKKIGIEINNAFDSQAAIQLKSLYCDNHNCMQCKIGHQLITSA